MNKINPLVRALIHVDEAPCDQHIEIARSLLYGEQYNWRMVQTTEKATDLVLDTVGATHVILSQPELWAEPIHCIMMCVVGHGMTVQQRTGQLLWKERGTLYTGLLDNMNQVRAYDQYYEHRVTGHHIQVIDGASEIHVHGLVVTPELRIRPELVECVPHLTALYPEPMRLASEAQTALIKQIAVPAGGTDEQTA